MNHKTIRLFFAAFLCFMLALNVINVQAALTIKKNEVGSHDGYNYELWKDYGTTSMSLNSGGAFSCSWSNIGNALFRKGRKFDSTKTHNQIGTISINYACDYQPNGNSYLCVYGWSVDPLIEYYIVDSWGSWRPPGGTSKGTITVDGGTYDVYVTTRTNQPSIQGTKTFQQYWSVRTTKNTSGTISVSEHFKAWEDMGMNLGKMYEVALTIEGFQSSGTANVYSNSINISGGEADPTPSPSPAPTLKPNASKPKQVKKLSVKNAKKNTAAISWQKVTGTKGYQLTYATDKKFSKNKKSISVSKINTRIGRLKKGKTYYFKVRAYNLNQKKRVYGKYSKVVKVRI